MSKVLVDRELLDSAATWLEVHAPGGGCVEGSVAEDLRAILEQPAEAEGVEVVAWQQRYICPDEGPSCWQSADERTLEILRRRDDYELRQLVPLTALSAVTAERDRLREDRDSQQRVCIAEMEKANQLRAEVETLRKDAERYRWASSGVHEAETLVSIVNCHGGYAEKVAERVDVYREAAMAAKEA